MKRFTTLLLFVLLAMAPFSASGAVNDHPDSVSIWGVTLDSAALYYHNGLNGAKGYTDGTASGANAHYDPSTGVLTLKNLNVTHSSAVTPIDDVCGIFSDGNAADGLTIVLQGNNSVSTEAENSSRNLCAVMIACNLTIQGSGTLEARAGKTTAAVSTSSYGLRARKITQTSGTIKAFGGETNSGSSYGVCADPDITVTGGSITGVGGSSSSYESIGVCVNIGTIAVSGGSITGIGGQAGGGNARSKGMDVSAGNYIITGGRLVGEAATGGKALNRQPSPLPSAYYWRTSDSAAYSQFPSQGYVWNAAHTYVDIRTGLPKTPSIAVSVPTFYAGQAPENETVTVESTEDINATNNYDSATMDGIQLDLGTVGNPGTQGRVANGSIVIHLNKAYLDSLPLGTHTLTVYFKGVYTGRSVSTTIRVNPEADVPATGDHAQPMLWLCLALMAGALLVSSTVLRCKRQNG